MSNVIYVHREDTGDDHNPGFLFFHFAMSMTFSALLLKILWLVETETWLPIYLHFFALVTHARETRGAIWWKLCRKMRE